MIRIHVLGDAVGCELLENGHPAVTSIDHRIGMVVSIEFSPEAWREFLKNAQRLRGVGVGHVKGTVLLPESPDGASS